MFFFQSPFLFLASFEPKLNLIWKTLLTLLLEIIHSIFDLAAFVTHFLKSVRAALYQSQIHSDQVISEKWLGLSKRPKHLAIVINEESIFHQDLAQMLSWCILGQVNSICIYDIQSKVKKSGVTIMKLVNQILHESPLESRKIVWHTDLNEFNNEEQKLQNDCHIYLLDGTNGRTELVKAAQDLCMQVKRSDLKPNEIDEDVVSQTERLAKIPEPELMFRVGPVESYVNCLPWHIRLTEMHQLDTIKRIHFDKFFNVLKAYSKCEQRFGK